MSTDPSSGSGQAEALKEAARHKTVFDVSSRRIARVYAEALLKAAQKAGQTDEILDELYSLIADVLDKEPVFEGLLDSMSFGRDRKRELIEKTLGGRASEILVNFLLVLNDHDRLSLLRPIGAHAREMFEAGKGRVPVLVKTAVPLPDDQRDKLLQDLRESFKVEPVPQLQVDPEILGGMIVRVGDWLYDASVRTQLANLRNLIFERSRNEIQSRRDRFSN